MICDASRKRGCHSRVRGDLTGSVLWKQRAEMRQSEAREDVDRGVNGAVGQWWRAEAEIQKSQSARAAAGAGEGYTTGENGSPDKCFEAIAYDGLDSGGCVWASDLQLGALYLGLYLTALGTSGLKSSISGFDSYQFDETDRVLRN
ncbi:hypothetical protein BHM03_00007003 [Ensete ventricosum]|nr:hypothetical protein BHM03_00007003 [Ensete ventricosum]